jgi:hypothetical protein
VVPPNRKATHELLESAVNLTAMYR